MHPSVIAVLFATRALWTTTPSLNSFTAWPDDLVAGNAAASPAPAAAKIIAWQLVEDRITTPLHRAIQHAAPHVNWQFIYKEAEVGRQFLDNYGYFELIGPTGHFRSDKCNAYIAYWGPDLYYPAHHHASEEPYFVLSGAAMFGLDDDAAATLGPAEHRFHASHQPYAMTTTDSANLTWCYGAARICVDCRN
jgi:hypothetical protein